ncbi:MAG: nodulation protein NfeD, partial [Proteobacteria bacterium]|nr:nodulation protein NfeD [Pseudomonadota bacterium]
MKTITRSSRIGKRQRRIYAAIATVFLGVLASTASADGNVVVLELKGGIGVATADYITSGIEHAEETAAELIIINMDTPGGLMAPMRDIV